MKRKDNQLPAEVWLDYIEGETDKSLKEDLERLLSYRKEYQKTVNELKALKAHFKDTAHTLPDDAKFAKLKSNIMSEINKITPDKKISPWHRHNKVMTYTTMAVAAVVTGALVTQTTLKTAKTKKAGSYNNIEDHLIAQNMVNANHLNDDLLMQAVAEKLSNLSEKQANEEIEKLK